MRFPLLLASAAMLTIFANAAALATDDSGLITVTAARDQGYLVDHSVTATRTETPLLNVPQSISVFSRARLDDQAILSITDALRYVPGAVAAQGEGNRDQIVLRGNNSSADFFVDGLRDDVQYYRDFYNIDQLEILKGPNALIFGRGGAGGIINRVSKSPFASTDFANADASVDSFGGWRLGGDIGAPLVGGISARLNAVYEDGRNHRQFYDLQRWAINPTIGFDLAGKGRLVIGYEHADDDRLVDRGVPSENGHPLLDRKYRNTFFGDRDRNRSIFNGDIVNLNADYGLTDQLTLRQRARYGDYDKLYRNLFPATAVSGLGGGGDDDGDEDESSSEGFGVEAYQDAVQRQNLLSQTDLEWHTRTGAIQHVVLAGIEFGRQITRSQRLNGYFDSNNATRALAILADPFVPPPFVLRPGPGQRDNYTRTDLFAAFVQDQIAISPHFEILAGVRYDRFSLDYTDRLTGAGFGRTDNLWSPRLGLIWKPVTNASIYASYSRSYLPQSGDQFTNLTATQATLKPEQFQNYEIGGKWDVTPGLNLTAALYRLERTNTRANGLVAGTTVLTGATRSQGLELAANGKILPDWQISIGLAVQDAEIRSTTAAAPAGRKVPLVPHVQASFWTRYDLTSRLGFGAGVTHQGGSYATISNAVRLPAYTRVDAAGFFSLTKQINVQINVENLFNTGYFPTAHTDNNISTGGPRSARFTIRTRF